MWWYWANESTTEGRRWLEAALARAEGGEALLRGRVLLGIAQLAMILGDLMVIPQYANEALALYRDIDNRRGVAYALQLLGIFATFIDYATARRHLEESLELARTLDDSLLLWSDLFWLGYGCVLNDDFADARTYLEESLTVAQRRSSPEAIAQSNSWLGFGAWMQGDLARARAHYEDAIAVSDAAERVGALYLLGQTLAFLGEYAAARSVTEEALVTSREVFEPTLWGEPIALWNMAMIDQFEGRSRESRETVERAIAMLGPMTPPRIQAQLRFTLAEADLGVGAIADARAHANEAEGLLANSNRSSRAWLELTKAKIDRAEGEYASAEAHAHEALALTHAVGTLPYTVHALEVIAGLAAAQQSFREATRVYAAAERVRNEIGFVRPPVERGAYDASVAAARAAIGKDFDEAWAEGAAMSMDEAVAYARRGRGERKRPSSGWAALTPTELEVSRLVAQGLKNAEIAERMFISVNTVETHLKHVFTKLSLSSRTELALEAARQNSPAS
jgi:DNA-binding CsgD family transcriptional regulator